MARFGENLKAIRKGLRLNQKELAAKLRTEAGQEMTQAGLSKREWIEFSPKPATVSRLAEGLAPLLGQPPNTVAERLLDGVLSRFDAVTNARIDPDPIDRLRELIASLPADKRADLVDTLEKHALAAIDATGRKGA